METYYKRKRRKTGLASSDMAKELGIDCRKYSLIENGVVKMPKNLIDKFNEVINKGKNEHMLERLNHEQLVNEWYNDMTKKVNGRYKLKDKMKEFNIDTFSDLAKLLGVSSANLSHYLKNESVGYNFKNKMYLFFSDELNIQEPSEKRINNTTRPNVKSVSNIKANSTDNELLNWYRKTDLKSLAKSLRVTSKQIAEETGLDISCVHRVMNKLTDTPREKTLGLIKGILDGILDKYSDDTTCEKIKSVYAEPEQTNLYQVEPINNREVVETTTACVSFEDDTPIVINGGSIKFNERVSPELEKCDETPVETMEKCDEEPTEHIEKCDEEDIKRRYQTEIEENNVIIETYRDILNNLLNRNRVCEEVLKVIDELRGE